MNLIPMNLKGAKMVCSVCHKLGHNSAKCPQNGPRVGWNFQQEPKSKRCECCGQYGYEIHRHHTRDRGNNSYYLDVCFDCHLKCGHQGDFQNIPIKPQVCRVMNRSSYWCQS